MNQRSPSRLARGFQVFAILLLNTLLLLLAIELVSRPVIQFYSCLTNLPHLFDEHKGTSPGLIGACPKQE